MIDHGGDFWLPNSAMEDSPDPVLSADLGPSERLLWSGRPHGGIRLRSSDALVIPFSLVWCGFAIFWETGVISSQAPIFFKFWGIPFVVVGLYFVFGRFFVDALARSRTYYGITNERALIVTTLFGRRLRSIGLRTLGEVSLSERSDQSGTITFGAGQPIGQPFGRSRRDSPPAFEMIDNVKQVYQLIVSTQRKLLAGEHERL